MRGMQPTTHSSRGGGCTFAEDPMRSCAEVTPIWSADVDPRVLRARIAAEVQPTVDLQPFVTRLLSSPSCHRICLGAGPTARLDIFGEVASWASVSLTIELSYDGSLSRKLLALRLMDCMLKGRAPPLQKQSLHGLIMALRAWDGRRAGAGLRTIADRLLGTGEWPGAGEHRKSRLRRLVALGRELVQYGPSRVLSDSRL